ncbi:MAG: hypothetical protein IT161_20170 [Bryobacterales bacterium]|nr:hypothetical protein [Bryobacterales bacterium]
MKRILFVCYGNACRSQMAEAFAKSMAPHVEVESAGLAPLGYLPEAVYTVMAEAGVELGGQYSKEIDLDRLASFDLVVNMSGVPWIFRQPRELVELDVLDPFGANIDVYRKSRDQVREIVESLLDGKAPT